MKMGLEKDQSGYKVYLYIFYICGFIMISITFYGIYGMTQEWQKNGTYVMGEILEKTEFPTAHFAKTNLVALLFYNNWLVLRDKNWLEENSWGSLLATLIGAANVGKTGSNMPV